MSGEGSDLLKILGIGILQAHIQQQQQLAVNAQQSAESLQQENNQLRSQIAQLSTFEKSWKESDAILNRRKDTLENYKLTDTIKKLPAGPVKDAYEESIRCFLFDRNLAASNMVCLAIEALVRMVTKDEETPLYRLIERLEEEKRINSETMMLLHTLRKMRNRQSHTVNTLKEVSLLALYEGFGDLARGLGYVS